MKQTKKSSASSTESTSKMQLVRLAMEKSADQLPMTVQLNLNNPDWTTQDLANLLHKERVLNPQLSKVWGGTMQLAPFSPELGDPSSRGKAMGGTGAEGVTEKEDPGEGLASGLIKRTEIDPLKFSWNTLQENKAALEAAGKYVELENAHDAASTEPVTYEKIWAMEALISKTIEEVAGKSPVSSLNGQQQRNFPLL